jgi:hypothetical protein
MDLRCYVSRVGSDAMLVRDIKSKPTYAPLTLDLVGKNHILIAQGIGGAAVLRLLAEIQRVSSPSGSEHCSKETIQATILYVTESVSGENYADQFARSEVRAANVYSTLL